MAFVLLDGFFLVTHLDFSSRFCDTKSKCFLLTHHYFSSGFCATKHGMFLRDLSLLFQQLMCCQTKVFLATCHCFSRGFCACKTWPSPNHNQVVLVPKHKRVNHSIAKFQCICCIITYKCTIHVPYLWFAETQMQTFFDTEWALPSGVVGFEIIGNLDAIQLLYRQCRIWNLTHSKYQVISVSTATILIILLLTCLLWVPCLIEVQILIVWAPF